MKRIVKGKETQSLLEHRLKDFSDYDNFPKKDELRVSLLTEQGYICCYCMQRISDSKMKLFTIAPSLVSLLTHTNFSITHLSVAA